MIVSLNYDEAKRLVEAEIAKEGSDYVYMRGGSKPCLNVDYDAGGDLVGSCLVGRALVAAGVEVEILATDAYKDADIIHLNESGVVKLTHKARRFLGTAQGLQDQGRPWGYALENAIQRVTTDSEITEPYDDTDYL